MVFPWFSHGFPMVFLWFSYGYSHLSPDQTQDAAPGDRLGGPDPTAPGHSHRLGSDAGPWWVERHGWGVLP